MPRVTANSLSALALALILVGPISAQTEPKVSVSVAPAGLRRFEPGRWASLRVLAGNPTDQDADVLVAVYFGKDSNTQYARQLWVPANARRYSWLSARLPEEIPFGRETQQMTVLALEDSGGREVIQRTGIGPMLDPVPLTVDQELVKTALLFPEGRRSETEERDEWEFYEHVIVPSREMAALSRVTVDLGDPNLGMPRLPIALDGIDQLIIASDRIANDTSGMAAIRHWVGRGGRLWLPLNRLSPQVVEQLVGHAVCYEEVDRVELSNFTIRDMSNTAGPPSSDECEFERPVVLVRVLTEANDVPFEVNGWPAAFWQPVGEGEVLFTTLEPRGWSRDREGWPTKALRSLSLRLYQGRETPTPPNGILEPMLREQIGYRVPRRAVTAAILGFNCLGLLAAGVWLARRRKLELLAVIVPAITVLTAGILITIGAANNRSIPPTLVSTQFIQVSPETGEANVSGIAATYQQRARELRLGLRGGVAEPIEVPSGGKTRRLVWHDDNSSRWLNLNTPPGSVQFVGFETARTLPQPIVVRGSFGPQGFQGRLVGKSVDDLADVVISAPPSFSCAVTLDKNGEFTCGPDQVLAPEQYLADTILSDVQRRRQQTFRRLLDVEDGFRYPRRATLFAWTSPMDVGLEMPDAQRKQQAALICIPVSVTPTPPKTQFVVPASFISVKTAQSQSGRSSVFDPRTGRWLKDFAEATNSQLRFVLPPQIQPCRLQRATLTAKVHIPSRSLEIAGHARNARVPLRTWESPSGMLTLVIDTPEVLDAARQGFLDIEFIVSDPIQKGSDSERFQFQTWHIDYVRLDVAGETL